MVDIFAKKIETQVVFQANRLIETIDHDGVWKGFLEVTQKTDLAKFTLEKL